MVELVAFHFKYSGFSQAETYRFYKKHIRGFLRWHRGSAVWIKGGTVKRDAVIVVTARLASNVQKMMSAGLAQGGQYIVKPVDPHYAIYQAKELDRETVGYLRQANIILGDPDSIHCPKENYEEVSVREHCRGDKFGARCDAWDGWRCVYPQRLYPPFLYFIQA